MEGEIIKGVTIFLLTMLKFIAGPTLGYAAGFSFTITVAITVGGMMASVFLFTYLGTILREKFLSRIFKRRRVFSKRNRRFVQVWKKYGLAGVAFLTPLIFTPIGGTVLLTTFGSPRSKIIVAMLLSAVGWSIFFTAVVYLFGTAFLEVFIL